MSVRLKRQVEWLTTAYNKQSDVMPKAALHTFVGRCLQFEEDFMSVANLTRYENLLIGDLTDEREMIECATGSYVKFEEAVEASSNSIQQLKAEIAALTEELLIVYKNGSDEYVVSIINKLRQLSAV
jgi:hypothetical protein